MSNIDPLHFELSLVDPTTLKDSDHEAINHVYREAIEADCPGRTQAEYDYFVHQVDLQRRTLNAGVGGPLQQEHQAYSHPVTALIFDKKRVLKGVLTSADNASARIKIPGIEQLELRAKLTKDRLIRKRWATFGARAFTDDLIDGIGDTANVSIVDVAAYLALEYRDDRQPVSSYPYRGERLWADLLRSWGILRTPAPIRDIPAFGQGVATVEQATHRVEGNGVVAVRHHILHKPGALNVMSRVNVRERLPRR